LSRRERCNEGAAWVLGSITVDRLTEEELLTKTCGNDWSAGRHDVAPSMTRPRWSRAPVSPTIRLGSASCWSFWLSTVTVSRPGVNS
jgi:hypothetical protein